MSENEDGNNGGVRQNPDPDPPRRKRGRPRVLDLQVERKLEAIGCYERKNSRRSRVDYIYMTDAMTALGMGKDERFHWLLGPDTGRTFRPWRQSLLAELGRCGVLYSAADGAKVIQDLAQELCKLKPLTRAGAVLLRRYRCQVLKQEPQSICTVRGLSQAIGRTLNDYLARHPGGRLSTEDIREALDLVSCGLRAGDLDEHEPEKGKRER